MRGRRRARRGVTARRRRPYPTPTRRRRRQAPLRRCRSLLGLPCLRHPTPPFHGSLPVTNSWLYIPLLLDGAGLLSLPAKEAWRGYAPCAEVWPALVTTLAASAPVPPADLAAAVQSAAVADAEPGEAVEDCMHPNPRMTLRAAVLAAASTDGYLTAATQSAFLQIYGGEAVTAEAAALADRARAAPQPLTTSSRRRRRGGGPTRSASTAHQPPGLDSPALRTGGDLPPAVRCTLNAGSWEDLDRIELQAELRRPLPTLQDVPPFLRAGVRRALVFALQAVRAADVGEGAAEGITPARAWTFLFWFLLTPRLLLARPGTDGAAGRRALKDRLERYERGDWPESLRDLAPQRPRHPSTEHADALLRKRRDAARRLVRE